MPYDEKIETAIDAVTGRWKNMGKKRMFGGVFCLLKGNMCFGIYKDFLVVRAGKEAAEKALKTAEARPFDITGRSMAGWVMVDRTRWDGAGRAQKLAENRKTVRRDPAP